jgi:hypothetical protein
MIKVEYVESPSEFEIRTLLERPELSNTQVKKTLESQTEISKQLIKVENQSFEERVKSAEEVKDRAVAKAAELSANLDRATLELENKQKEIAIFVKKHARVRQVENENAELREKNAYLQAEVSNIKREAEDLEKIRIDQAKADISKLQSTFEKGKS